MRLQLLNSGRENLALQQDRRQPIGILTDMRQFKGQFSSFFVGALPNSFWVLVMHAQWCWLADFLADFENECQKEDLDELDENFRVFFVFVFLS